ncbi:outer membrane lipoprotein-sorting protein [Thermodesulfobacteriota bacterium]
MRILLCLLLVGVTLFSANDLGAMTAQEILDEVVKRQVGNSFRVGLSVKTFKGKKRVSNHFMWLMGKAGKEVMTIFLEFEEPKESKGLRFLFQGKPGEQPKAFMYLPSTGTTLPLGVDNKEADIGGTGLTMEDIRALVPEKEGELTLLADKKVSGEDCYVIRARFPDRKLERQLWISKENFIIMKSQQLGPDGKVKRTFRVAKLFTAEDGKLYPREEDITVPKKKMRIKLRQDNATFGILIPKELTAPETFGKFKWKL